MQSLKELMRQLNDTDECSSIEAKRGSDIGKSILETICAYSNEPHLGGGYLLLGVEKQDESVSLFPHYEVTGVPIDKLDQLQTELASKCAIMFNHPIRPSIVVEMINEKPAIVIYISELSSELKPLYILNQGLPQGAYRRIGAADYKCTADDMGVFYKSQETLDSSILKEADYDDLSEESIALYRKYRREANVNAEELEYGDEDLLRAIRAINKNKTKEIEVTYTGLLTFGSRMALRRLMPMMRVDYIRVSTNDWIADAEKRFESTLDMRGSLLELVQRIISTISDDLPRGFELSDGDIQAKNMGLPMRVLREAVVNALIHRSYREHSPIQIIRYPNRIEIINPGFSLKSDEQLGEPGSMNRNPFISAIFHDTNLAETKGSGIRTMRRLMEEGKMMPPTFESDRENNKFTVRLLLHHLLNVEDFEWLESFSGFGLNDSQKRILVFVREVGAIDNISARQINGADLLTTNADLRKLKELNLLIQKGKNKASYYLASELLLQKIGNHKIALVSLPNVFPLTFSTPADALSTPADALSTPANALSAPADVLSALPLDKKELLNPILKRIEALPKRINDKTIMLALIKELCAIHSFKLSELVLLLGKTDKYILREYLKPLIDCKELSYTYPDMVSHPNQSYKTVEK
ncbi:putative DNA binding domain-containing protein [Myroides odoratimimus]|uniref:ATP-binding protein n=1 Tax=Myroides odoratimimus TaxID=76832 RepID=UPI0020977673|nr:ATP-binding protein [Myroides odoratimimus]MCO7722409.1 putative DNA binding domain-containing protein [Myroides odoratimimus]